jgi:G3E family GTPase
MEKQGTFDYILLETTGLADPGNIAPLFWVDEGLGSTIYLDGIVTLIDAKNILKNLDDPVKETVQNDEHDGHEGPLLTTAHLQISHADVIVINKSDLVSEAELLAVRERVEAINGLARIHVTEQGQVPQLEGLLLDLHAYDNVGALDVSERGHSHLDPVVLPRKNMNFGLIAVQTISTITLPVPELEIEQLSKLDAWLRSILWDGTLPRAGSTLADNRTLEIHRLKARLPFSNGDIKIVQGVREIFEILDGPKVDHFDSAAATLSRGKIVLIGRELVDVPFEESFRNTVMSR